MGYGDLYFLIDGENYCKSWCARSGSMNSQGKLVNCITTGDWYIVSKPQKAHWTECKRMHVKGLKGNAWKWRLWPYPVHRNHAITSHMLIHPDGSLGNMNDGNGTKGCIGLKNNAPVLLKIARLLYIYKPERVLKLTVERKT